MKQQSSNQIEVFKKSPVENINLLNQIIPQLIKDFQNQALKVFKKLDQIIQVLLEKELLTQNEYKIIILNQDDSHLLDTHKFIVKRIKVLLENIIEQAKTVDHFGEITKFLMDANEQVLTQARTNHAQNQEEEPSVLSLLQAENTYLQQILAKGLKQKAEKYENQKMLTDTYIDISLSALIGLNLNYEKFKSEEVYKILKDLPVLDHLEDNMQILMIKSSEGEKDDFYIESQEEGEGEIDQELYKQLIEMTKQQIQKTFMRWLPSIKNKDIVKQILEEMNKWVIPNFQNPILLSDFLTNQLDQNDNTEIQFLALKGIFILLEKHGLDYPNYYKKLYTMIQPTLIFEEKKQTVTMNSIFQMSDKHRFLRLFDLSLRSASLPSKLIASFIKRLARIVVSYGACFTPQDTMFIVSFIANLIKRHPRCNKLLVRKALDSQVRTIQNDPFKEDEADPMETKALHSSLWEIEVIMKQSIDQRVRDYTKMFKTDLIKKNSFFKTDDFTLVDPIEVLALDLAEIDDAKEAKALKKNLLIKNKQQVKLVGVKRNSDTLEQRGSSRYEYDQYDQGESYKRFKYGEDFEEMGEILALRQ
ncbi:nucleolar complex protein 4 homolog [Stylonychia lemnae]|uniref:Nucleolar complex protein 4 homolog n=1 Tax=Stylonychia lemnae TaxID=5949 RepID=A0A078B2B2_STYLE|nr:nucleolar complex protein 4 homolog [Stylonychia lemnae]|eukprot:CDW88629.1 nucleolar complex protein 4 homolog [Stylonychia lemnae]